MAQHLAKVIEVASKLRDEIDSFAFSEPIAYVYNPLQYAWKSYYSYLTKYASTSKKVIFIGMNPGPFGMTQTGIPFGEIRAVRDWVGIFEAVGRPKKEHPKRPIEGFDCKRSEVSGKRLWGLFEQRFGKAENFFKDHLVLNYCPLVFMEASGKNLTPDKLRPTEQKPLLNLCDACLRESVTLLEAEWIIGVGDFAFKRVLEVFGKSGVKVGKILHPSPASPVANKDWGGQATRQLEALGVWPLLNR